MSKFPFALPQCVRPWHCSLIFFLGLILVYFWPFFFLGMTYYDGALLGEFPAWYDGVHRAKNYDLLDGVVHVYALECLFQDQLRQGHWPLWNPYNLLGNPMFHGHGSYHFYPLTALLHLLLPVHRVHDWMLVLHTLLCGLSMTWFLRLQGRSFLASHFGAIAWTLSGPLLTHSQFHQTLIGLAWFPAYLGCISLAARRGRKWLILACLVGGLGVSVAPINLAWICLGIGVLWSFFQAGRWQRRALQSLTLAVVPLLLSAAQTWPTLEIVAASQRSVLPAEVQTQRFFQLLLEAPGVLFFPDLWGHPSQGFHVQRFPQGQFFYFETCFYIGFLPAILSFLGWLHPPNGVRFFRNLLFLQLLILSTPLWNLAALIPNISKVNTLRTLVVACFCLCVLGAAGLDRLMSFSTRRRTTLGLLLALGGIGSGVFLQFYVFDAPTMLNWLKTQQVRIPFPDAGLSPQPFALQFYRWSNPAFWVPILLMTTTALLLWSRLSGLRLGRFLLLFTIADLVLFGFRFQVPAAPELLGRVSPSIEFLQEQKGNYRVLGLGVYRPNTLVPYKIQELTGYFSLIPRDCSFALSTLEKESGAPPQARAMQLFPLKNSTSPLIDLLGVRFLVTYPGAPPPRPDVILRDHRHLPVYENPSALPRVWSIAQGKVFPPETFDISNEIKELKSLDLRRQARLHGPPLKLREDGVAKEAVLEQWGPGRAKISLRGDGEGWVIFNEQFYPGWKALVDGRPQTIYRAHGLLMAVPVTAQSRTLEFFYWPDRLTQGIAVSLCSLLLCLASLWVREKKA